MASERVVKLSKHFTLKELTGTSVDQFAEQNRKVSDVEIEKLREVCRYLLEPIREKFQRPIRVTSGYRCWELNNFLGGAPNSQHLRAEAVDFIVDGFDDEAGSMAVFEWIYRESGIEFGQVIHEIKKGKYREAVWIHISLGSPYRPTGSNGEAMLFRGGKYILVKKLPG